MFFFFAAHIITLHTHTHRHTHTYTLLVATKTWRFLIRWVLIKTPPWINSGWVFPCQRKRRTPKSGEANSKIPYTLLCFRGYRGKYHRRLNKVQSVLSLVWSVAANIWNELHLCIVYKSLCCKFDVSRFCCRRDQTQIDSISWVYNPEPQKCNKNWFNTI